MEAIDRAVYWVSRVANIVGISLLFGIMALVSVNVVLRYVFKSPITGTFELVELMLALAVFLGFAYATRTRAHITADFIAERLPLQVRNAIDLLTTVLSAIVFGFMAYALWLIATGPGTEYETTGMLLIPVRPFKVVASVSIGLVCLELVMQAARIVKAIADNREPL